MDYTLNRLIAGESLVAVDARTRTALASHGFGVLTEIDGAATMKKKLDVDMPGYRILGACNPKMAFAAIGMEPRDGAMLPCNVILREVAGGIEVSAIAPGRIDAGHRQPGPSCRRRPGARSSGRCREGDLKSASRDLAFDLPATRSLKRSAQSQARDRPR